MKRIYGHSQLDVSSRFLSIFSCLVGNSCPRKTSNQFPFSFSIPYLTSIPAVNTNPKPLIIERRGPSTISSGKIFSKLQLRSSNVDHIELRRSIADFDFLLRAPKFLKTLTYEIGNFERRFQLIDVKSFSLFNRYWMSRKST